jgi:Flp pilus assembly protein protease CpaA
MQAVLTVLAVAAFLAAAYGDIRSRRIPNKLALAIGVLGVSRMVLVGDPGAAAATLLAAAAMLAIGFGLFWRGIIGGGDAKLVSGATLLVGYGDLFSFLFLMSLCGGLLALAVLAQDRIRPRLESLVLSVMARDRVGGWIARHQRASVVLAAIGGDRPDHRLQLSVPYGVAISAAGIITLGLQTILPQLFISE